MLFLKIDIPSCLRGTSGFPETRFLADTAGLSIIRQKRTMINRNSGITGEGFNNAQTDR